MTPKTPVCLTIAGLDPSGGAGVIADIKTFRRFGCFPTAAVTSITFQNTLGVYGVEPMSPRSLRMQIEPIISDMPVRAVKTGMLPTSDLIEEVAALVKDANLPNLVVDPVIRSTSGFDLLDDNALQSLIEVLFPMAALVTPNLPEAERISGVAIISEDDIREAAEVILSMGARAVLMKGGHLGDLGQKPSSARDLLFVDGNVTTFEAEYLDAGPVRGTGCALSAAIAANLALGEDLVRAFEISKSFITEAIRASRSLGHGASVINV